MIKDETGKRVFFHGPDFNLASRLSDFDVYVVLGKDQGCPNALLEALAAGLPAIANNDGGTSELIIHEQTGLLVNNDSPEELSKSLVRVLSDRDLAEKIGIAGREYVLKMFSMGKMSRSYLELFRGSSSFNLIFFPKIFLDELKNKIQRCNDFIFRKADKSLVLTK